MTSHMSLSQSNANLVKTKFKLANAWQIKENFDRAYAGYQEVLSLQADYFPAYIQLGHLMLQQKNFTAAEKYYEQALTINFNDTDLSYYYKYLRLDYYKLQQETNHSLKNNYPDNSQGKINLNLNNQKTFNHRSGWSFALNTLKPLHNSQGILFDGCLENNFLYKQQYSRVRSQRILDKMKADGVFKYLATLEERHIVPYKQPWVGFVHNPPNVPSWFINKVYPEIQTIFEQDIWQKSLKYCVGLFCLSEYHAQWLRSRTNQPVVSLIHPTQIPDLQFNFQEFLVNPDKKIVQVGWWLRKLNSIYQLPIAKNNQLQYEKIFLLPNAFDNFNSLIKQLLALECQENKLNLEAKYLENTNNLKHLSNTEYDILLSKNIAFINLYDTSANNGIIECIARATPILVNPLPAVKEYLGKDYPFYFSSLEEAASKVMDIDLIRETHIYLKNCETRAKLSPEYFLNSFQNNDIYQSI
jgi:hypothetical protein